MSSNFNTNTKDFKEVNTSLRAIHTALHSSGASGFLANYLKLDASNDPLTGALSTQILQPSANDTYDIGLTGTRYKDMFLSGDLDVNGHVAFGSSAAIDPKITLNVFDSNATNGEVVGVASILTGNNSSGNTDVVGFNTDTVGTSTSTGTNNVLIGVRADVNKFGGAGLTTEMKGFDTRLFAFGSGSITNARGLHIRAPNFAAVQPATSYGAHIEDMGVIGTTISYGLKVDNQTGSTDAIAIGVDGGRTFLAGNLHVGGTSSKAKEFEVTGEAEISDTLLVKNAVAFGPTASISSATTVRVVENFALNGRKFGIRVDMIDSGGGTIPELTAIEGNATAQASSGTVTRLTGLFGKTTMFLTQNVTTASGVRAGVEQGVSSGTITTANHLFVRSNGKILGTTTNANGLKIENVDGSTIGTSKAISIDAQTALAGTSWTLAIDGTVVPSYHEPKLRLGGTTSPTNTLSVTGDVDFSGDLEVDNADVLLWAMVA